MVVLSPLSSSVVPLSICRVISSLVKSEATEATMFGIELIVVKISQAIMLMVARKPTIANVFVARSFCEVVDGPLGDCGCVVFIIVEATTSYKFCQLFGEVEWLAENN